MVQHQLESSPGLRNMTAKGDRTEGTTTGEKNNNTKLEGLRMLHEIPPGKNSRNVSTFHASICVNPSQTTASMANLFDTSRLKNHGETSGNGPLDVVDVSSCVGVRSDPFFMCFL